MPHHQNKSRKIIHVDMDCFYAAIEVRDNPSLKGLPVAVGGRPEERSVICTANYEARTFGIHSAMPSSQALRLCPSLNLVPPDMKKYKDISKKIKRIFQSYTDLIEPLSLDEAFLDVSLSPHLQNRATCIAQEIRNRIFQSEELTASAGISFNKFLAKVASDWNKPNGQFVIRPEEAPSFMATLPVKKIFGVGPKMAEKLNKLNIHSCGELQQLNREDLILKFGSFGERLYNLCRGIDDRDVNPKRERKSLSVENTYSKDLQSVSEMKEQMLPLLSKLKERLSVCPIKTFRKVYVKLKFSDFSSTTVECVSSSLELPLLLTLLEKGFTRGNGKSVRLLGCGVRFTSEEEKTSQLDFWEGC